MRIVADESNNAILVMASAQDYQVIESALKRLDVIEEQVLIEASILEVTLSDELSYGLEWYIKNKNVLNGRDGEALLDLGAGKGISSVIPGFSYTLVGGSGVDAVLNALPRWRRPPCRVTAPTEGALMLKLAAYPAMLEAAAAALAPHDVAFYLRELSGAFHSYYAAERFLTVDAELTRARLALLAAVAQVLAGGLAVLGVGAPEQM